MHKLHGVGDSGQLVLGQQILRQPVANREPLEIAQGLLAQRAHPGLLNPLGQWVNRRQGCLTFSWHRRWIHLVFRVVKLITCTARTNLAKAANPGALAQLVFLGGVEMKKTHHQEAAVIPEGNLQAAPAPHHEIGFHDLPFNHRHIANAKASHGYDTGAVFVPMGQMEQQILQGGDTQLGELLREGVPYALELGDRYVIQ